MRRLDLVGPRGIRLRCLIAGRRRERVRGLLDLRDLRRDEALLIPHATSVHTFGVRFPILVVRIDESFRVVDVRRVPPCRLVPPRRNARHVLECHPDTDLRAGDVLRLEDDLSCVPPTRSRRDRSSR